MSTGVADGMTAEGQQAQPGPEARTLRLNQPVEHLTDGIIRLRPFESTAIEEFVRWASPVMT